MGEQERRTSENPQSSTIIAMEDMSEKREPSLIDTASLAESADDIDDRGEESGEKPLTQSKTAPHRNHGPAEPDIDHLEIEGATPGHDLDVELAEVSYPSPPPPPSHHPRSQSGPEA